MLVFGDPDPLVDDKLDVDLRIGFIQDNSVLAGGVGCGQASVIGAGSGLLFGVYFAVGSGVCALWRFEGGG